MFLAIMKTSLKIKGSFNLYKIALPRIIQKAISDYYQNISLGLNFFLITVMTSLRAYSLLWYCNR